jgi:hypothetical protein
LARLRRNSALLAAADECPAYVRITQGRSRSASLAGGRSRWGSLASLDIAVVYCSVTPGRPVKLFTRPWAIMDAMTDDALPSAEEAK